VALAEIQRLTANSEQQDALTADAVENFLRQNEVPVLVDKGGMCMKLFVFELLN
jgi:hypothetical protein